MRVTEFQELSLVQLERITGIDQTRWSRYFSGKVSINSRTLEKAAKPLNMEPADLLYAIQLRILSKSNKKLSLQTS